MMLLRMAAAAVLVLLIETSGQMQEEDESLIVASSSFWLKVSPTPEPLYSESVQVLQSSVNKALQANTETMNHVTLSLNIDPFTFRASMDWYEIQNVSAIFRAVIFGNVTNAYTCIACYAVASVRTNRSNNDDDDAEHLADGIRRQIDTDLMQVLGSSTFLGKLLLDTNNPSSVLSKAVILQLYNIESVDIFPMKNSSSFGNMTSFPERESTGNQNGLLHWDIALIVASLLVLVILIVSMILRSGVLPICRDTCHKSESPSSAGYPATNTENIDMPSNRNNEVVRSSSNELDEVFESPNDISNIIVTSPSILTLTSYDNSNPSTVDFENPSKTDEEYCSTDIMESLDATTSMIFANPSSSSSDEEATHSLASSEEDMILALLSTASRTSPSSSVASNPSIKLSYVSRSSHRGTKPSSAHEEINASSLAEGAEHNLIMD